MPKKTSELQSHSQLLTKEQVCSALGIAHSKFYELVSAGELPAKKLKSSTRVMQSDLDKFIQNLPSYPVEPAILKRKKERTAA